ncbi:putative transcription factor ZF-HD family [Helianthus debilis subsp. tardiflorus]
MDLKHPTTKIPHHESETPPHSQSTNLITFPNGKTHHHHPPPHTASPAYKECLKNHAVAIGGHALDGCGEFMPSPTYSPAQPSSFKCAACGCHRNFHRREPTQFIDYPRPHQTSTPTSISPGSPANAEPTNYAFGQHLLLSLGRGPGTAADQNHTVATPGTPAGVKVSGNKRFRTKFSPEQKQKMLNFAEKVGWKMQRCDDKMVADFCNEIGIRRRIFKVWMHNNKNTSAKREKDTTINATGTTTVAAGGSGVAASVVRSNESSHQENGSSSSC